MDSSTQDIANCYGTWSSVECQAEGQQRYVEALPAGLARQYVMPDILIGLGDVQQELPDCQALVLRQL